MREAILSNIFTIIVIAGYSIFAGVNFYNFRKYAGNKIKSYKHRSTTKTMGYVILALGSFYLVMFILEKEKTITMIVTLLIFMYFVVLISLILIRDILICENGIYYSGKFVKYLDMKDIEKIGKNAVQIKLNKRALLTDVIYMNKVEEDQELLKNVKKNIKIARKNKKLADREEKNNQ